jgi:release factor glutamine methyltransferase
MSSSIGVIVNGVVEELEWQTSRKDLPAGRQAQRRKGLMGQQQQKVSLRSWRLCVRHFPPNPELTYIAKIMEGLSNSKELFRALVDHVSLRESRGEVESIVWLLLEKRCGLTRSDVLAGKETSVGLSELLTDIRRINLHEPVQYVLGVADFCGREFIVEPSVLIPRPETEILVEEAMKAIHKNSRVLDVGTGSGCIAITLALAMPCGVTALDVSREALAVASANSLRLNANVRFIHSDFLGSDQPAGPWEVIVSNPPYVRRDEAGLMRPNVTAFEPHLALFVPDNDPLVFYRALADYGRKTLSTGGLILAEINESLGRETQQLFSDKGYVASLINDLSGKPRIVKAVLG